MIAIRAESNVEEVLALYEAAAPRRAHVLEISNPTPYAVYLHAKAAYWVVNDGTLAAVAREVLARRLKELSRAGRFAGDAEITEALRDAGDETVAVYVDVIGVKHTPGKVMPPPRPKHPGEWADDTETLANNYHYGVDGETPERFTYTR